MVYLDTNLLIYASVEQDAIKKEYSLDRIEALSQKGKLVLSTLSIQEFAFTMAKLGVGDAIIREDCDFYFQFVTVEPDYAILRQAIETCTHRHQCKNINDIQHLYLAEKSRCSTLVTYDRVFQNLEGLVDVEIEVL